MLHENMPRLSLATVYRNLEQLGKAGIVTVLDGAGPRRYDGNASPHHHKRCSKCGRVSDLDHSELAVFDRTVAALLPHIGCDSCRIEFSGVCSSCSMQAENGNNG
jgi:Fur family ferric uptake transcriptional regulator